MHDCGHEDQRPEDRVRARDLKSGILAALLTTPESSMRGGMRWGRVESLDDSLRGFLHDERGAGRNTARGCASAGVDNGHIHATVWRERVSLPRPRAAGFPRQDFAERKETHGRVEAVAATPIGSGFEDRERTNEPAGV